ncbi:hypothetical protein EI94DRAFT_1825381 [Lactarius quietus]|nr:hypothetical protein EI94DRAFT_1825381 [Lactarius quietus]
MKALKAVAFFFSLSSFVLGQQLITTTNQAGVSIVEQVTTNAFGQPLTQILQTLGQGTTSLPTTTSPSTSPTSLTTTTPTTTATGVTTTTTKINQGPVGQPASTPETPGGPTPFTYTTTNAGGEYITVVATFTPTFSTVTTTPTGSGTVLQYSEWLSQIGTNTGDLNKPVASQVSNHGLRAGANNRLLSGVVLATVLAGVVGGWVLVA